VNRRRITIQISTLLAITVATLASFQNCAGGQFHAVISPGVNALSPIAPNILTLMTPQNLIQPNAAFTVTVNQSGFPPGTTTYLWETDFTDGLIFCDETTSFDASTSSITCPEAGTASVTITVATAGSTTPVTYTLPVTVGSPAPSPTPTGTPGPTPSPSPTEGPQATYTYLAANLFMVCASCHNSTVATAGYDFSSLQGMINTNGIVPGSASSSLGYLEVSTGAMPQGGPNFATQDPAMVQALATWINNNAPND
jgi:hypothetical protein